MSTPNGDLSNSDLPDPSDPRAVFAFAMSFDGYKHFGSLEKSAKAARSKSRTTLDEIRNELFFSARASRHSDSDGYLETYRELLPFLRAELGKS